MESFFVPHSSYGSDELRILGHVDRDAEFFGKQPAERRACRQPARERAFAAQGYAGGKTPHTPGDGAEDAGGDIGGWRTPRKQADDFRLREYGAHAGNGGGLSPSGGFAEFRQLHAEDAGKDL